MAMELHRFNRDATMIGGGGFPPDWRANIDFIIMDFDKTITRAHTNGGVQMPAYMADDFITNNFADLDFFQWFVPYAKNQGAIVGIASFGGHQDSMLLSGLPLIRKYLDVAFGAKESLRLIPDDAIACWHPKYDKSPPQDETKVGKQEHIRLLVENTKKKIKNGKIALFDDDERNVEIATGKGLQCFFCPAVKGTDKSSPTGFHKGIWQAFIKSKGRAGSGCVIM